MPIKPGKKIETVKDKKPSARLRAVIYRYWEQLGSQSDSEAFYERHMNAIIEQYKAKLKPKI